MVVKVLLKVQIKMSILKNILLNHDIISIYTNNVYIYMSKIKVRNQHSLHGAV